MHLACGKQVGCSITIALSWTPHVSGHARSAAAVTSPIKGSWGSGSP